MEPAPITTGLSAEAKQPMNASSNDQGSENDVLLGWARSKRNKLRGGSRVGKTANFTEGPLGGNSRSRVVSYDAATSMGLSRFISSRVRLESWEFPGWGSHFRMISPPELETGSFDEGSGAEKLGEWFATAISGNDILSSVLYVSGLVTACASWLSPVCLAMVAGILYLYRRFIYGEAISALPMNGGAYNVLINATSKPVASFAACLAVISYIATGVVSAATAASYLQTLVPSVGLMTCTIGLLFIFACLMTVGISESAGAALGMFLAHVFTLTVLCVTSAVYAFFHVITLHENLQEGFPDIMVSGSLVTGSWFTALLFGFSSAMLGVSGFESSSQFVEEQAKGVFVKTLRNMQVGVAIFNPAVCLLSLCVLPMDEIIRYKHSMLAVMAKRVGSWAGNCLGIHEPNGIDLGEVFSFWVSLDAFVVLSGAVLTAYVGITGLISRMAKDRVLPQIMLKKNKWRGTQHNIIFGFFLLATSQVLILQGNITTLSGVYTFAFLGLMTLFSMGTIMLKFKRPSLPREVTVSYKTAIFGTICVIAAFIGNMISKPDVVSWFILYFMAFGLIIVLGFQRVRLLKIALKIAGATGFGSVSSLKDQIHEIQDEPFVFFCKQADLYVINKAILYVRGNEHTSRLLVVHVSVDPESAKITNLAKQIEMFDTMYPKIKISLLTITGTFNPELIDWLSKELGVLKNKFFITCLDSVFKYKIQELGGVRVITH
ncbi:unnamed protein product [Ascophyllum nodosum]